MTTVGLYVHIPFCDAKCHYCDFVTFVDKHADIEAYLNALHFELSQYPGHSLKTLFIGGGTPSVLNTQQISKLFSSIRTFFEIRDLEEATVELNPESVSPEKLGAFQKEGINRISFGLQTTNNALLARLGRLHDNERFLTVYQMAREQGFNDINVDLMLGLPGQTLADWGRSVDEVIALHPEHISAYALKIEPGTEFYREKLTVDGDLQADMYLLLCDKLRQAGFLHYEISNFAKPGHESKHNLRYWKNEETIGVGVSSATYINGRRIKNSGQFLAYLDRCQSGRFPEQTEEHLSDQQRQKENIMLGLRLSKGVETETIRSLSLPLVDIFLKRDLARIEGDRFSLTPQGWLLSNQLFQQLIS